MTAVPNKSPEWLIRDAGGDGSAVDELYRRCTKVGLSPLEEARKIWLANPFAVLKHAFILLHLAPLNWILKKLHLPLLAR